MHTEASCWFSLILPHKWPRVCGTCSSAMGNFSTLRTCPIGRAQAPAHELESFKLYTSDVSREQSSKKAEPRKLAGVHKHTYSFLFCSALVAKLTRTYLHRRAAITWKILVRCKQGQYVWPGLSPCYRHAWCLDFDAERLCDLSLQGADKLANLRTAYASDAVIAQTELA